MLLNGAYSGFNMFSFMLPMQLRCVSIQSLVKLIILLNRVAVSNSMEFSWNAVVTKKKKEKRSLSRK